MSETTPETFFGEDAGAKWRTAINACHAFAQASGAPVGANVVLHLNEQCNHLAAKQFAEHKPTPQTEKEETNER